MTVVFTINFPGNPDAEDLICVINISLNKFMVFITKVDFYLTTKCGGSPMNKLHKFTTVVVLLSHISYHY